MRNKITDLNNYLFAQLERLDDESITGDELVTVIERGKAIADVSAQIIANANLQLKVATFAWDMGIKVDIPALLQVTDTSCEANAT